MKEKYEHKIYMRTKSEFQEADKLAQHICKSVNDTVIVVCLGINPGVPVAIWERSA